MSVAHGISMVSGIHGVEGKGTSEIKTKDELLITPAWSCLHVYTRAWICFSIAEK